MRGVAVPGLLVAFAAAVLAACPAHGQEPSLVAIGRIEASDLFSEALDVSSDGGVVVGNSFDAFGTPHAVVWTTAGGLEPLPLPSPGGFESAALLANAICPQGEILVGAIEYYDATGASAASEAFSWSETGGILPLGDLTGGDVFSDAQACTPGGETIVGAGTDALTSLLAVRWDGAGISLVGPGDLPGGLVEATAYDVSADGGVIVGDGTSLMARVPMRWTEATGMVALPLLAGDTAGGSDGISPDGRVVAGWSGPDDTGQAVMWRDGGDAESLGDLPGGDVASFAYDSTPDGRTIVGTAVVGVDLVAFVWRAGRGMRSLAFDLDAAQVDVAGWNLESANAVSADGRTIVGFGKTPLGMSEGFVAYLPEPGVSMSGAAVLAVLALRRGRRRRSRLVAASHATTLVAMAPWDASGTTTVASDVATSNVSSGSRLATSKASSASAVVPSPHASTSMSAITPSPVGAGASPLVP